MQEEEGSEKYIARPLTSKRNCCVEIPSFSATICFKSEIYWCKSCQIPNYNNICPICKKEGKKFATDVRPVFPEEKILLECIMRQQKEQGIAINGPDCLKEVSVWNATGNNYYGNGNKLGIKISALRTLDMERIKKEYNQAVLDKLDEYQLFFEKNIEKFEVK